MTDTTSTRPDGATTGAPQFAFVHHLDPLRSVQGTRTRYDCPDLAAIDRHLTSLRRRIAGGARSPDVIDACRVDIDRLLDHRAWLTLPVVA
jgi:hypothetical protein